MASEPVIAEVLPQAQDCPSPCPDRWGVQWWASDIKQWICTIGDRTEADAQERAERHRHARIIFIPGEPHA